MRDRISCGNLWGDMFETQNFENFEPQVKMDSIMGAFLFHGYFSPGANVTFFSPDRGMSLVSFIGKWYMYKIV